MNNKPRKGTIEKLYNVLMLLWNAQQGGSKLDIYKIMKEHKLSNGYITFIKEKMYKDDQMIGAPTRKSAELVIIMHNDRYKNSVRKDKPVVNEADRRPSNRHMSITARLERLESLAMAVQTEAIEIRQMLGI